MGLSATQARAILLEAKLNDVEFEGQQINQARQKLSDQSAAYMNQLMDMEVPVPPSKSDFTSMQYSYNQNGVNNTITNIGAANSNGIAPITTQHKGYGATVSPMTGANASVTIEERPVQIKTDDIDLTSDKSTLYSDESTKPTPVRQAKGYEEGAKYVNYQGEPLDVAGKANEVVAAGTYYGSNGEKVNGFTTPMYDNRKQHMVEKTGVDEEGNEYTYEEWDGTYDPIDEVDPDSFFNTMVLPAMGEAVYQVVDDGAAEAWIGFRAEEEIRYYHDGEEINMDESLDENNEAHKELIKAIKQTGGDPDDYCVIKNGNKLEVLLKADVKDGDGKATRYEIKETEDALIEEQQNVTLNFDDKGRIASITDGNGMTIALTPQQVTNEVAYEDAMNKYEYEKQLYNKEQSEINGQMSLLQNQDKKLELKLAQLDTERQELTAELEACEKVLGENVDRTFKTFNG